MITFSGFCSASYSLADCGGSAGFWGGSLGGRAFGDDFAAFRDLAGLPINVQQGVLRHEFYVNNAIYGGGATSANATLCIGIICWDAGGVIYAGVFELLRQPGGIVSTPIAPIRPTQPPTRTKTPPPPKEKPRCDQPTGGGGDINVQVIGPGVGYSGGGASRCR